MDIVVYILNHLLLQVPICQPENLGCVKGVTVLDEKCKKSCEGLYVTSYFKSRMDEASYANFWSKVRDDYLKYKAREVVTFPDELKGIYPKFIQQHVYQMFCVGYAWVDNLKIIGIYIDTPAFDEVTKDSAASWSDMLSSVGGTFGLFTGFSLISGIEILFFLVKSLKGMIKGKRKI